jgi:hypothetical protein
MNKSGLSQFFHLQSVLFYSIALTSVVLLFRSVSLYGERHLQAPPDIDGRYLSNESLPGCPTTSRFVLDIQQSGIYLNGSMRSIEPSQDPSAAAPPNTSEERPSLSGLGQPQTADASVDVSVDASQDASSSQHITLAGTVPIACQGSSEPQKQSVRIDGMIRQAPANTHPVTTLTGSMAIGSNAEPLAFTAELEAAPSPAAAGH